MSRVFGSCHAGRVFGATAAAAAVALLAGCGGSAEADDAVGDAVSWMGPLDEIMQTIRGLDGMSEMSSDDRDAFHDAWSLRFEQYLVDCMAEFGFDYVPNIGQGSSWIHEMDPNYEDIIWGTREFAVTFGFAISRSPWISRPNPDWVDPNAAQLGAMSPAERDEWERAMHGDFENLDEDTPIWEWGCWGRASEAANLVELGENREFAALEQMIGDFWMPISNNWLPEHDIMFSEWQACMDGHGFGQWRDPDVMQGDLWNEHSAINWAGFDWMAWDWDTMGAPDAPGADESAAEAFLRRELTLAVYDYDCREAINLGDRQRELSHRLQAEFVEEHRAELDAWLLHTAVMRGEG